MWECIQRIRFFVLEGPRSRPYFHTLLTHGDRKRVTHTDLARSKFFSSLSLLEVSQSRKAESNFLARRWVPRIATRSILPFFFFFFFFFFILSLSLISTDRWGHVYVHYPFCIRIIQHGMASFLPSTYINTMPPFVAKSFKTLLINKQG